MPSARSTHTPCAVRLYPAPGTMLAWSVCRASETQKAADGTRRVPATFQAVNGYHNDSSDPSGLVPLVNKVGWLNAGIRKHTTPTCLSRG